MPLPLRTGLYAMPFSVSTAPMIIPLGAIGGQNGVFWQSAGALQGGSAQAQYLAAIQQGALAFKALAAQQVSSAAVITGLGGVYYPNESIEPVEDTGIRAGEITGWRAWRINGQGFLCSLSASRVWAPHEPMDTETLNGDLGIHAFKTLSRLLEFGANHAGVPLVLGQVEMWGDVIEHEIGYRAEHAAIISLERVVNGPQTILPELRRTYGVPWAAPPERIEAAE